jgi:uncharacterized membrane protein YbhN (UPF0104 family)
LRRFGLWKVLAIIVGGALLVLGIVLLVGRIFDYAGFVDELRHADPWWLLVCVLGEVLAYAGYVWAWQVCARVGGGPAFSGRTALRTVLSSLGATRMFAAAGVGGIAVLYWVLRQAGVRRHEAIVRVIGLNILLWAVFGAVVWGAALAVELGRGQAPTAMTLAWLIGVPVCFAGGITAVVVLPVRDPLHPPATTRARRALVDAIAGLEFVHRLVVHPWTNRRALAGTLLYWTGDILCLWGGLRAFGVDLGASALVLAFATGYLGIVLPLPTAGIGGVDAAMTLALLWVGVPLAPALLAVFVYRFFNFLVPTLPGLVALSTLPLLGRELRRAARAGAAGGGPVSR